MAVPGGLGDYATWHRRMLETSAWDPQVEGLTKGCEYTVRIRGTSQAVGSERQRSSAEAQIDVRSAQDLERWLKAHHKQETLVGFRV